MQLAHYVSGPWSHRLHGARMRGRMGACGLRGAPCGLPPALHAPAPAAC